MNSSIPNIKLSSNKLKISISLSFFCLSIIFSAVAQTIPSGFNLVAYESFDYTSGSSLLNANSGSGWTSPWEKAYQDRYLKTSTTGYTYTGLTSGGLRADFDNTCYGTCNQIAALKRTLPLQSEGVVYLQFISVFEASGGGGTPSIRLFNGTTLTGGIGASSGSVMAILDAALSNLSATTASLSAQNLVVVRIDYNLNKTEMWINPDLSTFDYSNPMSPSASASGFSPSFDRMDIYLRSGSIDEISILSQVSPPTVISGTTQFCEGDSTVLTASGGTTNSNTVDVWYDGANNEAFSEGWDTQSYTLANTVVNSDINGILNLTSTSGDPMINMFNLGAFDPAVYKYVNFRYRVVSGTAGGAQIFFLNGSMTQAAGDKYKMVSLVSDNAWHVATVDMSSHALWTSDGNITGIRFDYNVNTGVTMDIDFIELGTNPVLGIGPSITVTPTASSTYYVKRKGPNANTAFMSQSVTVNPLPVPTFTAGPSSKTIVNTNVTYTTQTGQTNYVWNIPGTLNTDYSIVSGGTSTDDSVVLKWLTLGNKSISVNYTNSNNCSASAPVTSPITSVRQYGVNINGMKISSPTESLDSHGAKGSGKSVSFYGEVMDMP